MDFLQAERNGQNVDSKLTTLLTTLNPQSANKLSLTWSDLLRTKQQEFPFFSEKNEILTSERH